MDPFVPKIIGFLCHWCSYESADAAGRARMEYPVGLKIVRVLCSGRVDPQFVLEAFGLGADGVIILGCHPGECHYKEGNVQAMKRYAFLNKILVQFGIEEERFRIDWVSAGEHDKFVMIIQDMVERLREIGPMGERGDS